MDCLRNGLATTPPMGWNSWNSFRCKINENDVKDMANALIETGLAGKGYKYVNIDDCWQQMRDERSHKIIVDKINFPNGISALA